MCRRAEVACVLQIIPFFVAVVSLDNCGCTVLKGVRYFGRTEDYNFLQPYHGRDYHTLDSLCSGTVNRNQSRLCGRLYLTSFNVNLL